LQLGTCSLRAGLQRSRSVAPMSSSLLLVCLCLAVTWHAALAQTADYPGLTYANTYQVERAWSGKDAALSDGSNSFYCLGTHPGEWIVQREHDLCVNTSSGHACMNNSALNTALWGNIQSGGEKALFIRLEGFATYGVTSFSNKSSLHAPWERAKILCANGSSTLETNICPGNNHNPKGEIWWAYARCQVALRRGYNAETKFLKISHQLHPYWIRARYNYIKMTVCTSIMMRATNGSYLPVLAQGHPPQECAVVKRIIMLAYEWRCPSSGEDAYADRHSGCGWNGYGDDWTTHGVKADGTWEDWAILSNSEVRTFATTQV